MTDITIDPTKTTIRIVYFTEPDYFSRKSRYTDCNPTGKWKIETVNGKATIYIEITHLDINYEEEEVRIFDWLPWFTRLTTKRIEKTKTAWVSEDNIIIQVFHPVQECDHEK